MKIFITVFVLVSISILFIFALIYCIKKRKSCTGCYGSCEGCPFHEAKVLKEQSNK